MSDAAVAIPGIGGDGGGAAPPIDTAPVETAETPVLDTPVETGTETPPATEPQQATEDGRTIPLKHREYFKANPDIRAAWFENGARKQIHPTVQAAREDAELVQEIGGREGWQSVQEGQEQQKALDEKYYSRNPQGQREFVKNLITQDKGAFSSIVPVALDEFFGADPKGYNRIMSRVVANTFAGAFNRMGAQNYLAQALQILGTNPEQAKNMLTQVGEWMGQFEQIANQQPEVDPDREAFENEKKEWQSQKDKDTQTQFEQGYKSSSGQKAIASSLKHLETMLGDAKFKALDEESRGDLMRAIFQKVNGIAMKDANYLRQMKAILSRKDAAAAERYFLSKFNQLLPDAAKKVARLFNLSGPAPKQGGVPPAGAPPAARPGWVTLSKAPLPGQIDRGFTTDAMIMKNEAILKDGKKVRWPQTQVA